MQAPSFSLLFSWLASKRKTSGNAQINTDFRSISRISNGNSAYKLLPDLVLVSHLPCLVLLAPAFITTQKENKKDSKLNRKLHLRISFHVHAGSPRKFFFLWGIPLSIGDTGACTRGISKLDKHALVLEALVTTLSAVRVGICYKVHGRVQS
jgi:hypothetical protein